MAVSGAEIVTVQQACREFRLSDAVIRKLITTGVLPAHKVGRTGGYRWEIEGNTEEIAARVEMHYPAARPIVFPVVRYHLTDEECWSQSARSFMSEDDEGTIGRSYVVVDDAYKCPHCGASDRFAWNGFNYYCDCRPSDPVLPIPIEKRYESSRFPYPAGTTSVQPVIDDYYAAVTRYIRTPAASNWPRGRNDPQVNRTNEGAPRVGRNGFRRKRSLGR